MPMYNLIEHSDNYSKTSGTLWQYYGDEPNKNLTDSESFKYKIKITENAPAAGNKIMAPLKYLSNFWRTLEMLLVNCEVNLILSWSSTCVVTNFTGTGRISTTDTNLYVPVVTLSTKVNAKLLEQLKSGFQRTMNWNKYQSNISTEAQNQHLDFLINPSFQGVNRLFLLSFANENDRTSHSNYYLPKVEIKDYNVKIDGRNFLDQPINNNIKTYDNFRKIATCKGDNYATGCLLDNTYFKENYKMIATDLSKQQALDDDPRAILQINFTANLDRAGNTTMLFIIEEAKETILDFSQNTAKVLQYVLE